MDTDPGGQNYTTFSHYRVVVMSNNIRSSVCKSIITGSYTASTADSAVTSSSASTNILRLPIKAKDRSVCWSLSSHCQSHSVSHSISKADSQ